MGKSRKANRITNYRRILTSVSSLVYNPCMADKRQRRRDLNKDLKKMPEPVDMDNKINIHMSINHDSQEEWGHVAYHKAYAMFVFESKSSKKVGESLGIPVETVKTWIRRDKWTAKREEVEKEIMEAMHSQALLLIAQNHGKIIRRHLNLGEKLDKSIDDCLDEQTTVDGKIVLEPESINFLSKAFKNSADVTHRIARITDKERGDHSSNGNTFNGPIQVNIAPSKAGRVIDI